MTSDRTILITRWQGTKLQMIAADDIGWFGAALNRREIDLAGDVRTMPEAAEILTRRWVGRLRSRRRSSSRPGSTVRIGR